MTNKTFKCPRCGGREYKVIIGYEVRVCDRSRCPFSWDAANDHLYLKEGEPEIVRCPIKLSESGDFLIAEIHGEKKSLHLMIGRPGFSGFEFEDGSVSLDSPWAWKDNETGELYVCRLSAGRVITVTPVLAKFVRIKGSA